MTYFSSEDPSVAKLVRELKHINRWLLILLTVNILDLALILATIVAANRPR